MRTLLVSIAAGVLQLLTVLLKNKKQNIKKKYLFRFSEEKQIVKTK